MESRPALAGFTLPELEAALESGGVERYRARQAAQWIYRRRADSFEGMTDLSRELRSSLAGRFRILATSVERRHTSPDGTEKLLVRLDDGERIETVLLRDGERTTACVSTQAGCPIRCVFCASGLDGLRRDLEAHEIVEQVLHAGRLLPPEDRIDNLVVMGIGEPLLNVGNLIKALRIWKASWGMGIGYHRITLSTAGLLDRLRTLVDAGTTPNLALSLHAPNDRIRQELVPALRKWKVTDIVKAGVEYRQATKKEVTFEYVLIGGVNDDRKHALELGKKVCGTRCKVNVIPYNRVQGLPWREPEPDRIDRFVRSLGSCGVPVMVRKRRGDAIAAACGQLRASSGPAEPAAAAPGIPGGGTGVGA